MAKISTYIIDAQPTLDDKVIGTDVNDLNMTKNYLLGDIIALSPSSSLSSTKMFYGDAANVPAETNTLTYHVGGLGAAGTDTTQIAGSIVMSATDADSDTSLVLGKDVTPLANRPGQYRNVVAIGNDVAANDMSSSSVGIRESQLIGSRLGTDFVSTTNSYIIYSTLIGDDTLNTQSGQQNTMSGSVILGGRSAQKIQTSSDDVFVGFWNFGNSNSVAPTVATDGNTFVGSRIGNASNCDEWNYNVVLGNSAMQSANNNNPIENNVVIGNNAARSLSGERNIILGSDAAYAATSAEGSVILTPQNSGVRPTYDSAQNSILIGRDVARSATNADFNQDVYIGNLSGVSLPGGGHTLVGAGTFAGGGLANADINNAIAVGLGAFGSASDPGSTVNYPIGIGYLAASNAGNSGGNYSNSICIGNSAGSQMNGENNVSIGNNAHGGAALLGFFNVAVGTNALMMQTGGDFNVAVGNDALFNLGTGTNNTAIGKAAGSTVAGFNNTTSLGHNSQPQADNEVVLGDNNVQTLRCNTQVISGLSDLRDKNNVEDLRLGVDFLMDLKPVSWDWERRDGTMEGKKDSGFIAQFTDNVVQAHSAEDILPTLVNRNNADAWEMGNAALIPVLVKAIQELKAELDALKK
tara:strand:+ start:4734 stop:6644 length:1911 start_codon:yes stop_codon:yes gene_type:complete